MKDYIVSTGISWKDVYFIYTNMFQFKGSIFLKKFCVFAQLTSVIIVFQKKFVNLFYIFVYMNMQTLNFFSSF